MVDLFAETFKTRNACMTLSNIALYWMQNWSSAFQCFISLIRETIYKACFGQGVQRYEKGRNGGSYIEVYSSDGCRKCREEKDSMGWTYWTFAHKNLFEAHIALRGEQISRITLYDMCSIYVVSNVAWASLLYGDGHLAGFRLSQCFFDAKVEDEAPACLVWYFFLTPSFSESVKGFSVAVGFIKVHVNCLIISMYIENTSCLGSNTILINSPIIDLRGWCTET